MQPVLDARCVECHQPGPEQAPGAAPDLRAPGSYEQLLNSGRPSLRELVAAHYAAGRSVAGEGEASRSALWTLLASRHHGVELSQEERKRLLTWMDLYGQRQGSFSEEQEHGLDAFRTAWRDARARTPEGW